MALRLLACLVLFGIAACDRHAPVPPERQPEWLRSYIQTNFEAPLRAVEPSDGIDLSEAQAIAGAYYGAYIRTCGGIADPVLKDHAWTFVVLFGINGTRTDRSVTVDSRTGGVWGAGPRYRDFASFHTEVLRDVARPY